MQSMSVCNHKMLNNRTFTQYLDFFKEIYESEQVTSPKETEKSSKVRANCH